MNNHFSNEKAAYQNTESKSYVNQIFDQIMYLMNPMVNNSLNILEMNEFLLLTTGSIQTKYGEELKVDNYHYNYDNYNSDNHNYDRNVTSLQKAHES